MPMTCSQDPATITALDTVVGMEKIKHAKIARELEASVMSEKALNERVEALEQEVGLVCLCCLWKVEALEQKVGLVCLRCLECRVCLGLGFCMLPAKHGSTGAKGVLFVIGGCNSRGLIKYIRLAGDSSSMHAAIFVWGGILSPASPHFPACRQSTACLHLLSSIYWSTSGVPLSCPHMHTKMSTLPSICFEWHLRMCKQVKDVSSTCRARMRWLEQASDSAKRRVEALFRELQTSAPLAVGFALHACVPSC
eukprot:scaffold173705_cov16-Tisochrysis_lutea.AAC.1